MEYNCILIYCFFCIQSTIRKTIVYGIVVTTNLYNIWYIKIVTIQYVENMQLCGIIHTLCNMEKLYNTMIYTGKKREAASLVSGSIPTGEPGKRPGGWLVSQISAADNKQVAT